MESQLKPDIFVSHITEHSAIAKMFKTHFQRVFGEDIIVFVSSDYESIGGGEVWFSKIIKAITDAQVIIVLLSKDSVARRWINFEAGVGYGAGRRVVPVVIDALQTNEIGAPLAQLQVRFLRIPDDANGMFRDIGRDLGDAMSEIDVKSLQEQVKVELQRLPVTSLVLEPAIHEKSDMFIVDFTLTNSGNRDARLIKLWAAVPQHLIVASVTKDHNPPVLEVSQQAIDDTQYETKTYTVTQTPILSAYDQNFPRLPRVFSLSMSPLRLERFRFHLKKHLSDAEKEELIYFQLFAEGTKTLLQNIKLKELLQKIDD
jgi:hypothetical protein